MTDLLKSRWAPDDTPRDPLCDRPSAVRPHPHPPHHHHHHHHHQHHSSPPPSSSSSSSPPTDLTRFMKIVARLKWKLPFLAEGYRLATLSPAHGAIDVSHAEIMFKIDFHEYYALLERAIVHLLSVFGTTISSACRASTPAPNVGLAATHRYHANVLEALQDPASPLHPVLGHGEVHEQLHKAKELRNRWKGADMTKAEREAEREMWKRRKNRENGVAPLASYNFERILTVIFQGLEEAYLVARAHLDGMEGVVGMDEGDGENTGEGETGGGEEDWDFIVDAMDWEAI
ncbi:hypothetical protein BO70DRAFT_387200 [Aspergillus heteromorphus CBS 117.55]|uniref:Uncharacterized protein n=1 Tax=Aspergillus heteromorphus CBS 117.55 TaxID=1448321 RepID=A0A317W8H6_9EURO|nr:uncharacterized protein BO70DRAFT_387200 [Aspergillus heteromorphus CBS 117.55]PWY82021.1 hypothetical protein BO70DRAFT_387200 [Aspergillus heteromorphus CBS 117.55]